MALTEFEIIKHFFASTPAIKNSDADDHVTGGVAENFCGDFSGDIVKGIGDDAAVLNVPADRQLVVTTDTLVESVHFPENANPRDLAFRSVAVNISDIAAMGGEPKWISLALTMPCADEQWLSEFSAGLREAARYFSVNLVGGDTTRGPLTLTLTAQGLVPFGQSLLRSGARLGEGIYVSGSLAGATAALHQMQSAGACTPSLLHEFYRPQSRVPVGVALRDLASACIDISDGLIADLQHIMSASGVGAELWLDTLPINEHALNYADKHDFDVLAWACGGGDDYELCFTMPHRFEDRLLTRLKPHNIAITKIGRVVADNKIICLDNQGKPKAWKQTGYQHF